MIESFVQDLSLWHIRRSRDRVGPSAENEGDKKDFYETTYAVLITLCKLLAPFMPFMSDEIYTNLTKDISVHLANWPEAREQLINPPLMEEMANGRQLASQLLMKRKSAIVKVRIPLKKLLYSGPEKLSDKVIKIVREEVNVLELVFKDQSETYEVVSKDEELKDISNQDVELGQAREIVRQIQDERKKLETKLSEKVDVVLPAFPLQHEAYIKRNALVNSLKIGEFKVNRL
jgi:isoleucyl-tRNA synthetase